MRVLMLAQSVAPIVGGEERVVEDLSGQLAARGHEVSIATLQQPGAQPGTIGGVPVHALRSSSYRLRALHRDISRRHAPPAPDPETVLDLKRLIKAKRPDVVHAHNWLVHSYLPLHRRGDAALVQSLHDYGLLCATKRLLHRGSQCSGPAPFKCVRCAADHYGALQGTIAAVSVQNRDSKLRRLVDLFLPVSEAVARLCRLGPREAWRVVPNFIGELPAPPPRDPRLDRLPKEPFILFLGDITVDKGAWNLAEVHRRMSNPPPLVMLGRNFLDELSNRPGIHVLGPWPHELAIEALRRSLFSVAPSICPEAFGLVALEAAAAGKATVASDIGGLPGVVVHERTGLLVPPGDRTAMLASLQRLIDDVPLRERLGAAAAEHAKAFAPEAVVPQFEDAYRVAIEARRSRQGAGAR